MIIEQQKKDIRASGRSARSLNVTADDSHGELRGAEYFREQEEGGPPTNDPGLRAKLRDWLDYKQFSKGFPSTVKDRIAYFISEKRKKEPTKRGNDPRFPGLGITDIVEQQLPSLRKTVRQNQITTVRSDILKKFNGS